MNSWYFGDVEDQDDHDRDHIKLRIRIPNSNTETYENTSKTYKLSKCDYAGFGVIAAFVVGLIFFL